MANVCLFTAYVKDKLYNDLYPALEDFIKRNWQSLDLRINNVHNIGGVALSDMEIKFVSVGGLPGLKIEFDVILDAEIEVTEGDYHYDDYDICNQWFAVHCAGDLACNLNDFQIIDINIYKKSKMTKPLSDALVPYIYKKDLESEAHDFLRRHYPDALKTPIHIDRLKLAEKMGLKVEMVIHHRALVGNGIYT